MIIRLTWQRLYKDVPITTRFVLANPGPVWGPLIEAENATYGDIIVLRHLEESSEVANSVKAMEFFKWFPRSTTIVSSMPVDSTLHILLRA
jgi:hypothetical protein